MNGAFEKFDEIFGAAIEVVLKKLPECETAEFIALHRGLIPKATPFFAARDSASASQTVEKR
jgi:hypothetical protein